MVCFHGRYTLGDKHDYTVEGAKDILDRKDVIALPLFLYDHSGITISCKPFSCPWDSGQVGFIYVDYEKIKKEFSAKKVGPVLREKVRKILIGEVETYDQYLRGDIYYYVVEKDGEDIDSLGGIFGYDEAVKEAESHIEWDIKDRLKKHLEKLKTQIQNKVPLQYRESSKV